MLEEDLLKLELSDWVYASIERGEITGINPENMRTYVMSGYKSIVYAIDAQLWSLWVKEFSFPASWWDMVKINFFPKWLLGRYGARVHYYKFCEVFPLLLKGRGEVERQLRLNDVGEIRSVVRKPTERFERFTLT